MIVNPASDGGRTGRRWPEIARRAAAHGLEVEPRLTEAPGHASELTRQALRDGAELIVAVGGDGTLSETVNGFYDGAEPVSATAELAVVARGSGCDYVRTFGIPKGTDAALEVAAKGAVRTVDIGRVSYTGGDGRETSRLYCNIASAGLTGVAADRINRSSKPLGATVAFAWGAVVTFFGHHNSRFHIRIDDREFDRVCNNVIVGNCRYFASGMKILPMARARRRPARRARLGRRGQGRPGAQPAPALPRHPRQPPQGRLQPRHPGGGRARDAASDRGRRRAAGRDAR